MRALAFRLSTLALLLSISCGDDTATGGSGTGAAAAGGSGGGSAGGPTNGGGGEGPTTGGSGGVGPVGGAPNGAGGQGGDGGEGGVDPWTGPLEALAELDLGTHEMGDDFLVPIPDRTIGFTLLSETAQSGYFGVSRLKPPSSTAQSVILNFEIPGTDLPYFVGESALISANPLSEVPGAYPIAEGNWRYRLVADDSPTTASTRVFVRRTSDGQFHGGVMDVNVIIVPGVTGSQYMSDVLTSLFQDYYGPQFGVTLGTVEFYSAPSEYGNIDSTAEFGEMLSASQGIGAAPAINLFAIGGFSGDLGGALGVAGGIPGSPMVHGTRLSGVAYIPSGNENYDASVLAHEIGHLGGLFHTTENEPGIFDPFSDTPTCPNINNPNNCGDLDNIMFPVAYGGGDFSALQIRTLQSSALYRGILAAGGQPSPPLLPAPSEPETALARWSQEDELETSREQVFGEGNEWPVRGADDTWLLAGHWCTQGARTTRAELADSLFEHHFASREGDLVSIAATSSMPSIVRARALELLRRSGKDPDALARAAEVAQEILGDALAGRAAKLAAIELLDESVWLSSELRSDLAATTVDPIVREALLPR